jgi:hypothetical protein
VFGTHNVTHNNDHRPQRTLASSRRPRLRLKRDPSATGIKRRPILGGLINEYEQVA